ncbi:hypothetical protein VKT23_011278 [Stygiomarasmius scandens]|uniref:Methyltransferase type 11 domain-containing protein n=1 Tax=Marasmiellus scandens TaxID=2682957 RepID=A0ABR1J930_9AGAR
MSEFWTLGHELFRSTPETFPVAFVPGNILDPRFLAEETNYRRSLPPLSTLRSLTPLQGHVSAIHASSIFHLFSGPEQVVLAKKLSALLSPSTGSVIFGIQQGDVVAGEIVNPRRERVYLHSLESWKSLWKALFPEGGVQVEANWLESIETGTRARVLVMAWSVTRL